VWTWQAAEGNPAAGSFPERLSFSIILFLDLPSCVRQPESETGWSEDEAPDDL
jgi:hypothetical protein